MSSGTDALRVLMVATRYFPYMGGVETHIYEVGRRLARANVEVTVLSTDVSHRLPATANADGIEIHRVRAWPSNKDYYFAPGIYRFITHGHWNLIHCQGYHNLVPPLAMLAALRANIPFVLTFHSGGDVSRVRKALRRVHWQMLRPLLLRAQKLIAVSDFEARFFQEQMRLSADRFVVIPNGAGSALLPEVPESAEIAMSGESKGPLIVSIGRLERYKGHQRVLAAMPRVLEQIPDARLRIVGVGPYEPELHKMARSLDVAGHVEIRGIPAGDRSSMASLIGRADLVAQLSEYEAQGLAVMDGLALRRPVLVASTSALQELADRGLARAIPLESTPDEVARAVVGQLRHPLLSPVVLPTWDTCADDLLALYRSIAWRRSCVS